MNCKRFISGVSAWFAVAMGFVGTAGVCGHLQGQDQRNPTPKFEPPTLIAKLSEPALRESSGVAASRLHPGLLWTHNDSGGAAKIYAFDRTGAKRGQVALAGVDAVDWEDMAAFQLGGTPWLLVADIGDNMKVRKNCRLYLLPEPGREANEVEVPWIIQVQFSSGPINCEAVAVDDESDVILLVGKEWAFKSPVFSLPLDEQATNDGQIHVAKRIGHLRIPGVTSLDISSDGRRALVLTYSDAFEYYRSPDEDWASAFSHPPRRIKLPARRQSEGICYSVAGDAMFITSEASPTPLYYGRWSR